MADEVTFYEGDGVLVTNMRFVVGSKTYALAHLTSVTLTRIPPDRALGVLIIIAGIVIGLMAVGLNVLLIGGGSFTNIRGIILGAGVVLAVGVIIAGIALAVIAKPKYMVRAQTASGEVESIVHPDSAYIHNIGVALTDAIVKRG